MCGPRASMSPGGCHVLWVLIHLFDLHPTEHNSSFSGHHTLTQQPTQPWYNTLLGYIFAFHPSRRPRYVFRPLFSWVRGVLKYVLLFIHLDLVTYDHIVLKQTNHSVWSKERRVWVSAHRPSWNVKHCSVDEEEKQRDTLQYCYSCGAAEMDITLCVCGAKGWKDHCS